MFRRLLLAVALAVPLYADLPKPCDNPSSFTPCDFVFELSDAEARLHPDAYSSIDLHAEFRSPRHRTFLVPAFGDGPNRLVIRFSPVEPGEWVFRLTSNIARFDGQESKFTAVDSNSPGFIRPANVHHWAYTLEINKPHLWMGDTCYSFIDLDEATANKIADTRAAQKFTHMRLFLLTDKSFTAEGRPDPAYFRRADERIRYLNSKGLTADLLLAPDIAFLQRLFPKYQDRERAIRYITARYAAMNVTWQLSATYEDGPNGRPTAREFGTLLKQSDPYNHPRSSGAYVTSSPLLPDSWMNFVLCRTADNQVGSVEHQFFPVPFVNSRFAIEQSAGAPSSTPGAVDTDAFRHRLWNATMDGQYLTYSNAATYAPTPSADTAALESPGARQMTVWFEFFNDTRHWELEPYFDVDGGRAVALEGVEYIVYVEKPAGPVEVAIEKHNYNISWIDPATGQRTDMKDFKGEQFVGEPPNRDHDWLLDISREGRKESMLRSYKFDSRPVPVQEVEQNSPKVPFVILEPAAPEISLSHPPAFALKLIRSTRATRRFQVVWTGEVVADGQGARVLGTGSSGTLQIPPSIATKLPAVLSLRVSAINANGKAYSMDRVYRLVP